MAMGMSYNEFWYGDPNIARAYKRAHEIKQEIKNQELWLQGLYNYKAFSAVIEGFSYGMNGKKGKRPDGYLQYPIAITEHEKEAERQRKIKHTLEWVARGQNE